MKYAKKAENENQGIAESVTQNKYHFEALAPIDNSDISVYEEAINFVFENQDIKNVAISGAYGSGKSSVLATYEKKYPEKKFIHVSLAHFEPDTGKKDRGAEKHPTESVLEGKVLNQLIHQLSEHNIPQTNFRIKSSLSRRQIAIKSALITALFVTVVHLVFSYTWIDFVTTFEEGSIFRRILNLTTTPISFFISGSVGFCITAYCIYSLVKKQRFKAVIRKLSLQGNDIELFENSNDSFFDKYLNEVLYLFENANVDVIVFEDMDRYEMEEIFERLREVNTLANIRLKNKNGSSLRFFFLLRDDLFASKDRTKFFDYIIPVVPVVDSSNSYDQLIGQMKENHLEKKFEESFLQGLSLYIDDMRLLKNICNEFLIYFKRLETTELDYNKMLAIITYKNVFPRDFSGLQAKRGFVYALFSHKAEFVASEQKNLQKQIDQLESDIARIKKEHLGTLHEVDAVYADREFKHYSLSSYSDEQLTDWLKRNLRGNPLNEYNSRRKLLEVKLSDETFKLEDKKLAIQAQKKKLLQKKLSEIISRENIDAIFSVVSKNALGEISTFDDVKRSQYFDLLKYLIRNGYIDETYADYMTYFYPNSLTTVDKIFLQSVTNKVAKEFTYELKDPALVFSKLNTYDFDEEETLNFTLLTYLLEKPEADECLQHFIMQLKINEKYNFISQYLTEAPQIGKFVEKINMLWPEFFAIVVEKRLLPETQIWEYAHNTLYFSTENDILSVNVNGSLQTYISTQEDFLNIDPVDEGALLRGLAILNIKFKKIDYACANRDLFMKVYEQDCYVLNYENINLVLREVYGVAENAKIRHKSYSLITSDREAALYKYVKKEIGQYVASMLEYCNRHITDEEPSAVEFLNHPGISIEQKRQYIDYLHTKITSLPDIREHTLWTAILHAQIILFSEYNLVEYWAEFKVLDNALVGYINGFVRPIDMKTAIQGYEDSTLSKFFQQIVERKEINNEQYIQILASMNRQYEYAKGFSVTGVPDDKMLLLIENRIIHMGVETLESIRKNYPNVRFQFIKENLDKYVEIMTAQLAVHEEILEILSWEVDDEAKLALLKFVKKPISVVDKGYSTPITLYILQNRLDTGDLQNLYMTYPQQDLDIQSFVFKSVLSELDSIVNGKIRVADPLKIELLGSDDVAEGDKLKLLLSMLPNISKDFCRECFVRMGLNEFAKIFVAHSKPKIAKTSQNEQILKALQLREWVYDYPDYPYDDNFYTVRRNVPSKKKEYSTV